MRVVRSTTFKLNGRIDKVEVELTSEDLLPNEAAAPAPLHPQILDIRAEKYLLWTLVRVGKVPTVQASQQLEVLDLELKKLMSAKSRPKLRKRVN